MAPPAPSPIFWLTASLLSSAQRVAVSQRVARVRGGGEDGWVDVAAGAVVPARLVPPPETSVAVMV